MTRSIIYPALFVMVVVLGFALITEAVTSMSGVRAGGSVATGDITPENGEIIYWGKGKCSTCHSMGDAGSAIRGPNHESVYLTAVDRVASLGTELGLEIPTDYLVQSIAFPDAYVVDGFKAEMPQVYLPPIALQPDEIRSVVTYLQSQGGEANASVIDLPDVILETTPSEGGGGVSLPQGDASAGETLFFDLEGQAGCAQCHTYDGEGSDIGPDLTEEASVRTLDYIMESILLPSAVIASGYEPVQLSTTDGLIYTGVLRSEDETSITLVTKDGEEVVVLISDIDRRKVDPPSLMPDNFGDLLSTKEFLDILAFIQEGRQEQPTP